MQPVGTHSSEFWDAKLTSIGHADSFMDVPRLSTLQALMIILKAREQAPKRGYYYRSWMSIVQCAQMGKDLGLDEHFIDHQAGKPCGLSQSECRIKNRIWQTIFVCEVMIGSSQGKYYVLLPMEESYSHRIQVGLISKSTWKLLISMFRARSRTMTNPSTTYPEISPTSRGSSAMSAKC